MESFSNAINEMYRVRDDFLIMGLTGRTGAGCSTTAKILQKRSLNEMDLEDPETRGFHDSEERKYQVIYNFLNYEQRWKGFEVIEGSSIIISFILEKGFTKLKEYLENCERTALIGFDNLDVMIKELSELKPIFKDGKKYLLDDKKNQATFTKEKNEEYYFYYTGSLKKYKDSIYEILNKHICYPQKHNSTRAQAYTYLLQTWANNIRATGDPYMEGFSEVNYYDIAKRMVQVIDIIKGYMKEQEDSRVRICIDALRTPYEVLYLRDTYKAFQLISVDTEEKDRIGRLAHLSKEERDSMDQIEFVKKFNSAEEQFFHQDIQSCVEIADIHIYNPDVVDEKYFFLTRQLLKYVALMLHPGLVTPSHMERCMQLAYNAKINSSCLSRQVGAVITGDDFSVRAVGWNDVPKGQVPCGLRDISSFCKNKDNETYSEYERCEPEFYKHMLHLNSILKDKDLQGRMCAYCFKDIYNGYMGKSNQVHTRALHAEENAFLQITKYGGAGIKGGFLFTTSSPCELCAKKAYQLGITHIYYIEIYPGISAKHILSFGTENNPEMHLFYGAIGNAYISLYEPRMAPKDELALISGVDLKDEVVKKKKMEKSNNIPINTIFDFYNVSLTLISREELISERHVKFNVNKESFKKLARTITWTGSEYKGTRILFPKDCKVIDSERKHSPHRYTIEFENAIMPGNPVEYAIQTQLGDADHEMEPYLAHVVNDIIRELRVCLKVPKGVIENVTGKKYCGLYRELLIEEVKIEKTEEDGYMLYTMNVANPTLYHTYGIEWKWV